MIGQIGPIVAGSMADHVGWRNFWWLNVACLAVTFTISLVGFPETKWHRLHPDELRAQVSPVSNPSSEEMVGTRETTDAEKQSTVQVMPGLSHAATALRDPFLGKGKPCKRQFNFFQKNPHPFRSIFLDLWIPWKLFFFPIVEFASFVVSWSASSFLTLNLTQSEVFAAPPYNFSSQSIGFMNFAILIGAIIGLVTAGPLSDWVSMRTTKKNKGIREPEMRLPTMIPYVMIMIIGNFVVAFGYQHQWDWRVRVLDGRYLDYILTFPRSSSSLASPVPASKWPPSRPLRPRTLSIPTNPWLAPSLSPSPSTRTSGATAIPSSSRRGSCRTDTSRPS